MYRKSLMIAALSLLALSACTTQPQPKPVVTELTQKKPPATMVTDPPALKLLCDYPNGFDGAPVCKAAPQAIPQGAPVAQWRTLPSGVTFTDIAQINTHNGRAFELMKRNYLSLREWATTQCYAP